MINRVIRYLIAYEFALNFAFGLLAPIFAIFVLANVQGATLKVVGTSVSCYWIARVISSTPFSRFMDRTDGERDEYYFVIAGTLITSTIPILLIFAQVPWHLYLIQFVHGLSNSMAVPGWRILFTDHIDRDKVGYEWSVEDIAIGVAVGSSGYVGSLLADRFGFEIVLLLLSGIGYFSALIIVPLSSEFKQLKEIHKARRLDIKNRREHSINPMHHVK